MKGDFSRTTFNRKKHYSSVRMQQGRVQLDSDWNEQAEIQAHLQQTEAKDLIGISGAPKDDAGFQITVKDGDLSIGKGRYYVDGILCENEIDTLFTQQQDLLGELPPDTPGLYLVYLDVWQRHITALEDAAIREVALGGPDTTTRTKTVWQVKFLPVEAKDDPETVYCGTSFSEWDALLQPSSGKLSVQTRPGVTLENQLYRAEIHDGGQPGTATFKWSRDNASVAAKIEVISGTNITVSGVRDNAQTGFAGGQWVELTDEERTLRGKPGVLVELEKVQGNILTVKSWSNGPPTLGDKPIVRRWDSLGAITITSDGYINLEDGIQVQFSEGDYRSGDYWLIPARTATGQVEWPYDEPQPPHGIYHHYCRLALLQVAEDSLTVKEDCREIFSPLTSHETGAGVSRNIRQPNHGFKVGQAIYYNAETERYELAQSNLDTTTGMFLVYAVRDANNFTLLQAGYIDGLRGLSPGEYYYVSDKEPGELTSEEPIGISNPILYADSETGGYVLPYRPSETSQELLKEYIDNLLVGSVTAFAFYVEDMEKNKKPPEGWLECNGQAISRTEYARLFNRIGTTFGAGDDATTFNVPNLMGEFIRGWDHDREPGTEVDKDREFGSFQTDQMQSHKHKDIGHSHSGKFCNAWGLFGAGPFGYDAYQGTESASNTEYTILGNPTDSGSGAGTPRHGKETRPRNVALMYCIKF